jgi:hypothetical protein
MINDKLWNKKIVSEMLAVFYIFPSREARLTEARRGGGGRPLAGRDGFIPDIILNILATFFKKSGTKNCALDKFWDAPL